jgi:hypothetical protein
MNSLTISKMKSAFIDLSKYPKENLSVVLLFVCSVWFFMQAFHDLTWFEDELRGHWLIKRLICASIMSAGYLVQHHLFKAHFKKTSILLLSITLIFSAIISLIGPTTVFIFILILALTILFSLGKRNVLA